MANTVTQRTLTGGGSAKTIVRSIHIVSDGTEESDLVVYDNSAFIADTSKGNLEQIYASGDSCIARLEWDQTADSPIISLDPSNGVHFDFRQFGGIANPAGSGATGDIVLTTVDLHAGDEITLILVINQA